MVIKILLVLWLCFFSTANIVFANDVYANDDRHPLVAKGRVILNPILIKAAETNPECWSANLFPEGNWGSIVEGGQVSLRMLKTTLTNGEPVSVITLIRDATNSPDKSICIYPSYNDATWDSVRFYLWDSNHHEVLPKPGPSFRNPSGGTGSYPIRNHTQEKKLIQLNTSFDLTNGTYFVQAAVLGYLVASTNYSESQFEKVPFQIQGIVSPDFEIRSAKVSFEIK